MRGIYISLTEGDFNSYRVTLDARAMKPAAMGSSLPVVAVVVDKVAVELPRPLVPVHRQVHRRAARLQRLGPRPDQVEERRRCRSTRRRWWG